MNTDPIFSTQIDPTDAGKSQLIISDGSTPLALGIIDNDKLNTLNFATLSEAFEIRVAAARSQEPYPSAQTQEARLAHDTVAPREQEIIKTYGRRVNQPPIPAGIGASGC